MTNILAIINSITDKIERNGFRVTRLEYTDDMNLFIKAESNDDDRVLAYRANLSTFVKKGE